MFVSVMVYSQPVERTIIYVGQYASGTTDVRPEDSAAIRHIAQWVTPVVFLDQGVFNNAPADSLYGSGADAIGAEGVIISESIGSTGVFNFGLRDNYPVPCITMEGVFSNDPATVDKWPLLLEDGGVWGYASPEAVDVQWRIVDDMHYITETDGYAINQIVDYATAAYRGVPYLHGIAPSHIILATGARTDGGVDNPSYVQDEAIAIGYIENPEILYMNVAYTYLSAGSAGAVSWEPTADLYKILHRSVEFMFDAVPPPPIGIAQLSADDINFSVLPNPAIDNVTLSFTNEGGKSVSVSLISVTGGLIGNIYEGVSIAGNNTININTANYTPGLYFVKLQIGTSEISSKLIIK
jgi:hypothetical protein